jgi:hypothetical protein
MELISQKRIATAHPRTERSKMQTEAIYAHFKRFIAVIDAFYRDIDT